VTYAGAGLPIEVSSGTTLSMGASMLGGTGTFTLNAGATLESGHANGLDSALATTGTKTLSKAANYTFNGLLAQSTGSVLPDTVNNLTIKDTLGVRLSSGVTVNGALTFTAGKLSIGSKNLSATSIVGTSTANYIVTDSAGTLKRYPVGATQTLFPVGTTAAYSPVWITNAGTVDTFTVGVAPDALGGTLSGNGRVKLKWNINEKTAGGSNATLQFGWNASQEDANFTANRAGNALIVHLPDTLHVGTGAYTSQFTTQPYTLSRGGFTAFGSFTVGRLGGITSVGNTASDIPKEFSLEQNYPNPFNPSTVISYDLPKESRVSLKIYSMLGQEVATLVDEVKGAGSYTATFSAQSGFASGVYFYRIQAGDFVSVKKMMLLK
jgi:Secretion system C-terminal sorting domain